MLTQQTRVSDLKGDAFKSICSFFNSLDLPSVLTISTMEDLASCGAYIQIGTIRDTITSLMIYMNVEFETRNANMVCYASMKLANTRRCCFSQFDVPKSHNDDIVFMDASYEDYLDIPSRNEMLSEACWDSLNIGKYVCMYNTQPICVLLIIANTVRLKGYPTLITSIIHRRVDAKANPKHVAAAVKVIARDIYDTNYVRFLSGDDVCKVEEVDTNCVAEIPLVGDIWFTI